MLDKSGHVRWLRADAVRRLDDVGHFLGYTGCAVDITETKVSQQQQTTLIHELNHRVKNTLATVQSIAAQSLRADKKLGEARLAFESRLFALSRAHDVLTQESWQAAALGEIVERAVEPYCGQGSSRFHDQGTGRSLAAPKRSRVRHGTSRTCHQRSKIRRVVGR